MQPKISIVVCAYNTANYLEQCLDSVLAQQFKEWELLLIDDGSTDETPAICDRYAALDGRIRVIHKPNTGLSDSRNIGIREAKADFVGFVDSDDWIEPDMLSTVYDTLLVNGTDIVVFGYDSVYENKVRYNGYPNYSFLHGREALELMLSEKVHSYSCNKVFRRSVLVEPMPVKRFYEDQAVVYKWFAHANAVSLIDKPFYHYRQRQSSICNNKNLTHRRMDLFLANIERYEFCRANGMEALGKRMLVISGIRVSRDISRSKLPTEEKQSLIKTIADAIRPHADAARKLSLKKRFRYCLICHRPLVFIQITRLSGLWVRFRKSQSYTLFP